MDYGIISLTVVGCMAIVMEVIDSGLGMMYGTLLSGVWLLRPMRWGLGQ